MTVMIFSFGNYFFGEIDLSRDFCGYSKLMFLFFVLYRLMLSGIFYGLEIQHGIFMVLNFGRGIFWGFVGSPKDYFRF